MRLGHIGLFQHPHPLGLYLVRTHHIDPALR